MDELRAPDGPIGLAEKAAARRRPVARMEAAGMHQLTELRDEDFWAVDPANGRPRISPYRYFSAAEWAEFPRRHAADAD